MSTLPLLLAIHPEHVASILSGKKQFEYRKVMPVKAVSHLVLYSTAPVQKIVAVVEVMDMLAGSPTQIWNQTAHGAGITRQFYRDYFAGFRQACAFQLGAVTKLPRAVDLQGAVCHRAPPQSFYYLRQEELRRIRYEF